MVYPLMPKATAVWLVENTALTFEQIGDFCGMHTLEVQGIADGDVAIGIIGQDPVASGQLTAENLAKAEADPSVRLTLDQQTERFITSKAKAKGGRYTPVSRRQDKPDAVAWFVKFHPGIPDAQVIKLIGTTKNTINAVRGRTHWNSSNLKPKDPVLLGLCTQTRLDELIQKFSAHPGDDEASPLKANA